MNETLMALGAIAAMVWPATELIGTAFARGPKMLANKNAIAVLMGLLLGATAHGSSQVDMGPGMWGWINAVMLGLFATAGAAGAHRSGQAALAVVKKNGSEA